MATGEVGGPAPNGGAEVYGVVQQGDKYVFAGYGSRSTTPANGLDVVVYRFDANGIYDRTFGQDGLFTYNRVNGADRARDLTVARRRPARHRRQHRDGRRNRSTA